MAELCTIADVEVVSGVPVAQEDTARVYRLIEMASDVVGAACVSPLPDPVPASVAMVTANKVVGQMANPTRLAREGIAGYQVDYGATGMTLTEDDLAMLGQWRGAAAGTRFYSAPLAGPGARSGYAGWPIDWWARDYDSLDVPVLVPPP